MLENLTAPAKQCYPVEVSGWDSAQNFFVERSDLVWTEASGKQVRLAQDLRRNTIVFVRLLQRSESEQAHPVAYEAELVNESVDGAHQFRLKTVMPRLREAAVFD